MTNTTQPAIDTRSLRKEFGNKVAVEDLTLEVNQGEVFGFLGPNGSTLLFVFSTPHQSRLRYSVSQLGIEW
jgi:ABC-type branched-subunit amino acid transport system ATPase component